MLRNDPESQSAPSIHCWQQSPPVGVESHFFSGFQKNPSVHAAQEAWPVAVVVVGDVQVLQLKELVLGAISDLAHAVHDDRPVLAA